MRTELRFYQKALLSELSHLNSVAYFMKAGTGKTLLGIAKWEEHATPKCLIICPKSVLSQWAFNVKKERPNARVLSFPKNALVREKDLIITRKVNDYDVVIVNYDIIYLLRGLLSIVDENWTIILDESHHIKSWGTKRKPTKTTHAALALGEKTDHKIILTATPATGKYGGYIDYYTQLKFLGYFDFDYDEFVHKYVRMSAINFGNTPYPSKVITGYKNVKKLEEILKRVSRSYTPKIGDFEPQFIDVLVEQSPQYRKMLSEFAYGKIALKNTTRRMIAQKTMATGVVYGKGVVGSQNYSIEDNTFKIDWLQDFLEGTDEVVAVLYQYNVELASLEKLMKKIKKRYIVINGDTKDKFNEINHKEYDVVLGQYAAFGEALDGLQKKCHIEVFFAIPESTRSYIQTLGRIDRLGQESVPMYYFLMMEGTLDTQIRRLIAENKDFTEQTLAQLEVEDIKLEMFNT